MAEDSVGLDHNVSDEEFLANFDAAYESSVSGSNSEPSQDSSEVAETEADLDNETVETEEEVSEEEQLTDENSEEETPEVEESQETSEEPSEETEGELTEDDEEASTDYTENENTEENPEPSYVVNVRGKDVKVVGDKKIQTLISKGLGADKKLQKAKVALRTQKFLDENNVSDEDISFLLDLKKGDKSALNKLLKESKIDVTDFIDADDIGEYQKKSYQSPPEMADLEESFQDLQSEIGSQSFKNFATTFSGLDEQSRGLIVQNPEGMRILSQQIEDGTFEEVMAAVDVARATGEIRPGTPDIEAYDAMGTLKFGNPKESRETPKGNAEPLKVSTVKKSNTVAKKAETDLIKKKRSASVNNQSTKTAVTSNRSRLDSAKDDSEFSQVFDDILSGLIKDGR